MAAPFMDRVVHHAIHRIIEPILDRKIPESVYACRKCKGNKNAALALLNELKGLGEERFAIKLDVKKYFLNINHSILMKKLKENLPDSSIDKLLLSLLESSSDHAQRGAGIAIGNLTSQLFANFYLVSADNIAIKNLKTGKHFRYMDDIVLVGKNKGEILDVASKVIQHTQKALKLEIPYYKRMPLGSAPIPFLGYVLDHTGFRILSRNERKFKRRIRCLKKTNSRPSKLAIIRESIESWRALEKNAINCLNIC